MAATLADNIFECIFLNEKNRLMIQISVKFVPRSLIDNKPALVQVMAWCLTGDKPLHEPMTTQFTDAYIGGTKGWRVKWKKNAKILFPKKSLWQGLSF